MHKPKPKVIKVAVESPSPPRENSPKTPKNNKFLRRSSIINN